MIAKTIPVVCSLTSEELRERRNALLRKAGESLQETLERADGFAFRFPPERFDELAQIVSLERRCCAFLRFTLSVEPGDGPIWLEVTGPEEAKAFIGSLWS